jgi:hypothetical protein
MTFSVEVEVLFRTSTNAEAIAAAANHAAQRVRVRAEKKRAIRRLVVRSLAEGMPLPELARWIRDLITLSAPQRAAVRHYRKELEDMGTSPARVARLVETLRARKLRERAWTIALTEIASAENEAILRRAREELAQGLTARPVKTWLTAADERMCPLCGPLADKTVPLNKPFTGQVQHPPLHPRCRCVVAVTEPLPTRRRTAR